MPRNALALQTTFDDPGKVEPVGDDIDACNLVYAPDQEIVDTIEEERCPLADPLRSDGLHLYLNKSMRCHKCAMLHPSVRHLGCGLS